MASLIVPQEVAEHLNAARRLSKSEVLVDLLNRAQELVESGHLIPAVIVAGVVLEHLGEDGKEGLTSGQRQRTSEWVTLRNQVAHAQVKVTPEQVAGMIDGIRELLGQVGAASTPALSQQASKEVLSRIRGKYASVPTSSDQFIARKREDLPLEDRAPYSTLQR